MKKYVLSFLIAVLFVSSASVSAQTYKYLIFRNQAGSETGLLLQNLKLTFNGDILTASQNGNQTMYQISALQKMFFSQNQTGISQLEADHTAISLEGSTLKINAPAGTVAKVYDTKGTLVMSTKVTSDGTPANINLLQPNIYIVKAAQTKIKILVK